MLHNSEKDFIKRHIGPSKKDEKDMLGQLGYQNINELISQTVPEKILFKGELNIGEPNSEYEALRILKGLLWNIYPKRNYKKHIGKSWLVYFLHSLST